MSFDNFDEFIDNEYDFEDELDFGEDGNTETGEITYSIMGSDAPEDGFEMEFSEKDAEKLKEAEDDGEFLDSDYISENLISIHRKILHAIQEDLEGKSGDPHDGMVEKRRSWGGTYWEKEYDSHRELLDIFDDDLVEYTVDIYW